VPPGVSVTRLLVPALQAGCLIGKRGDIIRSIRDDSGATVRVLGEEELPGCAAPTERVVQVTGEWAACAKALGLICKQLRDNPLRAGGGGGGGATGATPPHPPRRAGSSPAAAAAAAAAAAGAQLLAAGGGFYAPPGWSSVGVPITPMGAGVPLAPMGYLPGSASPARVGSGGGGPPSGAPPGSASPGGAAAAPFSAHMGVPTSAVGSIIGKAGANVAQIRALSGARVKVHDQTPGATERLIEITGLPEQVAHAQVLVQGFLMTAGANASAPGGGGGRGGGSRQAAQAQQNAQAAAYAHAQHAHAPQLGTPVMMAPVMMAPGGAMYGYGQPVMYGSAGAAMYPYAVGMQQVPMQGMLMQQGGAVLQQPWPQGGAPYGMQ
jgi:hypothetical protein